MAQKTNLQCAIPPYRPIDKSAVISLLRFGIMEHVFFKAIRHTDHIGVTLSLSVAGYVLGACSHLQALLFGGAWFILIYHCCYKIYDSCFKRGLDVEMSDVQANLLDNPVNHFWVAETEVNGRSKVAGLLAAVGVGDVGSLEISTRGIFQLIVSLPQRRIGVGTHLVETAIEFCKAQGLSRVVVEISSPQMAAISLFHKLGFAVMSIHSNTHTHSPLGIKAGLDQYDSNGKESINKMLLV